MKKMTVSLVTIMTSLALSIPVYAATEDQETAVTQQDQLLQSERSLIRSADKLIGMTIVSRNGEDLGEIQDIKIDIGTGNISHITVTKGGLLGVGGTKDIAVPLEAFSFSEDNVRLMVDESKLDSAPQQADMADEDFQRGLESHYGISPAWQEDRRDNSSNINVEESGETLQTEDYLPESDYGQMKEPELNPDSRMTPTRQ
ncbi:MAG: PRC-barrel domain-containing protein [Desulforhopalus sp.]